MQKELNPDKMFQGLGFRDWLKLVFVTRARTIAHCDGVINTMVDRASEAFVELHEAQQNLAKLARLVGKQRSSLELAYKVMDENGWATSIAPERRETCAAVREALDAGEQPL